MPKSTPKFGKDSVLFFRVQGDTKAGARLAYQMSHELKEERSTETVQTKDGPIVISSGISASLEVTAVSSHDEVNTTLYKAFKEDKALEIWEVDLSTKDESNKYDARYMIGKLSTWALPAPNEGTCELSTSIPLEKGPVNGKVTLTAEQQAELEFAFKDLVVGA